MKKSEMIMILQNEFHLPDGMSEEIIDLLVSNGMMPPMIYKTKEYLPSTVTYNGAWTSVQGNMVSYEWEEE